MNREGGTRSRLAFLKKKMGRKPSQTAGVSGRVLSPSGVCTLEVDRDPSSPKIPIHLGCTMKSKIKGLLLNSVTEVPETSHS